MRTVGQHDADAIALADPEPGERGGERVGPPLEIHEGELGAEKATSPARSGSSTAVVARMSVSGRPG